ncbi:MAG TPA: AMP-binding protein [Anaerolineae bacterium]|nr:AMP-binding protein [Anaerolineae bacterium]
MTTATEQVHGDKGDTWPKILRYNCEEYGDDHMAMRHKHYGIWQPYTWEDYYLNVKRLALGLLSLGLEPGDKVLIVGDNAPEWYYAELAAQANHGVSVGAYSQLSPSEIEYIAKDSEARFAVVEDQEQVDKLLQVKEELPLLQRVIYWSYKGLAHYDDPMLMGYGQVLELGGTYEDENPGVFERNVETGRADDVCAIVYTSGTTGAAPKGAVHTFRTTRAGAEYYLALDPWHDHDNLVPYLPPAWMTEQWFGIGCHLLTGSILNFAEGPETQQQDAREIAPSILVHGARLWETEASVVQARMQGADTIKRSAFRFLMPIGYKVADLELSKTKPGPLWRILYAVAHVALFRALRDNLGLSKARICYATGAMLSPQAFKFYHALNLPLKSVYGSTEGGALAGAKTSDIRMDTVGPVHEGAELRIAGDGELLYRQPGTFVGYYKDPNKTAEVLRDGWFHSGDSGFLTEDGHLVFVDRLDALVELASGESLAPQSIESQLRFSPFIRDAWVLAGPDRAYTSAIIIIDGDAVGRWAGQRKVAFTSLAELSQKPEVCELVKREIDRVNEALPRGARLRKFVNLPKQFDPDEAELTRTGNLRRAFVEERYRKLVDAIYSDHAEVPIEAQVRYRDGRMRTAQTTVSIQSVEETG